MKETLSFDWLFQEMGIFFLSRLEEEFFLLLTLPRFLSRFSFPEFAEFVFGTSCVSEYIFLKLANLFWRFLLDPKALLARPQREKRRERSFDQTSSRKSGKRETATNLEF